MNQVNLGKQSDDEQMSVIDLVAGIKSIIRYLKSKWLLILIVSIFGALSGLCYSFFRKPAYTAVCSFVLEDSKSGSLGQYSGLASLAGINIGSGGGGGVFEGDNILELYRSRTMIENTLLSETSIDGKKQTLLERYINSHHLRKRWKEDNDIDKILFEGDPEKFNRSQDSIITDLVNLFNKKILNVDKKDKKLNIIDVAVTSDDELFAQQFANKLVETVNNFYVLTKTKKAYKNVQTLQHQADSVKLILNSSISGVASAIDAAPNANPALSSLRVPSQRKQVDVQASTAIYSEIVKNLELAKISFMQETPLIQVIDKPVLPLSVKKVGKISSAILGAILFAFVISVFLTIKRVLTSVS